MSDARILFIRPDLAERLEALYRATEEAAAEMQNSSAVRGNPVRALREEYEAVKAEAEADAEKRRRIVEMRSLTRRDWRVLAESHPPRTEGDDDAVAADRTARVNVDTVEDDLVRTAVVSPAFETQAAFDEWALGLTPGEWSEVVRRAWDLANIAAMDPKSLPSSFDRKSDAISE